MSQATIEAAVSGTGPVTENILRSDLEKIKCIENIINTICSVKGISCTRDRTEEEEDRLCCRRAHLFRSDPDLEFLKV